MTDVLRLTVPGIPVPQGSSRAFIRGGRAIVTSANARLRPWRSTVTAAAAEAHKDAPPISGPVRVRLGFTFPRPAGHFGKRGLRSSAPAYPAVRPDLDKLVRAVLDALTESGCIRDDAQVVSLFAGKVYGEAPGVSVIVSTEDIQA